MSSIPLMGHSGANSSKGEKNCEKGPNSMMCRDSANKLKCDKADCEAYGRPPPKPDTIQLINIRGLARNSEPCNIEI